MYIQLNQFAVHLSLTRHCKSTKIKKKKIPPPQKKEKNEIKFDLEPRAKSSPVFINKVLLANSHVHSFMCICECYQATVADLSGYSRASAQQSLKCLLSDPLQKKKICPSLTWRIV